MHEVVLEGAAQRELKRLSAEEFARVIGRIRGLAVNPRPSGSRKLTGSKSDWRLRIGDYRVVFDVEGNEIVVLRVGHRREIYKR